MEPKVIFVLVCLGAWVLYGVAIAIGKAGDAVTEWSKQPRKSRLKLHIPPPPTKEERIAQARKEYAEEVKFIEESIAMEDQEFYLNDAQARYYGKMKKIL